MQRRPKLVLALLSAALTALIVASGASAATLSGVVIHHNSDAKSFVIAGSGGRLTAVHARHDPPLGHAVKLTARRLRNGTWAATRVRIGRAIGRVHLRGTVTYVDAGRHVFVVSARGVSLLVHQAGGRHRARIASVTPLSDGQVVTVDGTLDGDSIDATRVHTDGHDANGVDLEGTVESIDMTARTLSISADDGEQSGATLTVQVPATFDLTLFQVGQSAELIVSPNPDGTYTLEQSSDDSGSQHADNPGGIQGDGNGDNRPSAEQQCTEQQNDPSFVTAHNGLSFAQFYDPQDPTNLTDAFGHCVDAMAQHQDGHGSGSDGSGSPGAGGPGSGSPGSDAPDS